MNIIDLDTRLRSIESLLLGQKEVMNFSEVAEYTGLSKSYLYKLTCSGGIPCFKPNGKQIYFSKKEIDNWLLSNRKTTLKEIDEISTNFVTLKKSSTK